MKRMVLAACVGLAMAWSCGAADLKIATVDLDAVFTAHPKTKAAEAELETAENAIKADMKRMVDEAKDLEDEIKVLQAAAKNALLTETAQLAKRNEAEEKVTKLQELQLRIRRTQETKLKQMQEQVMKSRQGIVDEITAAVNAFAEEQGYDLILDSSGMSMNAVPLMVYVDPELDVTEAVIARLQPVAAK